MLFDAKISAAYSGLTYSQRKVANYVQEKYEDVAFETLEKLAAKAGVSTTTVIRFSRALGYSGYSEMQEDIKKEIQTKGSLPDRLERAAAVSDNDLLSDTFTTDINNLNQTFAGLQPDELEAAIRLISGAKNIYVLGMRSSFSLAHYMVSRLGQMILSGGNIAFDAAAADLSRGDRQRRRGRCLHRLYLPALFQDGHQYPCLDAQPRREDRAHHVQQQSPRAQLWRYLLSLRDPERVVQKLAHGTHVPDQLSGCRAGAAQL